MNTKLFGISRPSYRYVLFSYKGKAIKKKEPYQKDNNKNDETVDSYKIIDYATLLSWYNENKARASAVGERTPAPEYSKKQRELKFLML